MPGCNAYDNFPAFVFFKPGNAVFDQLASKAILLISWLNKNRINFTSMVIYRRYAISYALVGIGYYFNPDIFLWNIAEFSAALLEGK